MNYKGKIVTVSFYHYRDSKPYKIVTGKVISIHTATTIRDTSTITIKDNNGTIHYGGHDNYYVIEGGEV